MKEELLFYEEILWKTFMEIFKLGDRFFHLSLKENSNLTISIPSKEQIILSKLQDSIRKPTIYIGYAERYELLFGNILFDIHHGKITMISKYCAQDHTLETITNINTNGVWEIFYGTLMRSI